MKTTTLILTPEQARARAAGTKTQHRVPVRPQPKNVSGPNFDGMWSETIDPVTRYFMPPFPPGSIIRWLAPWAISSEFDSVPSHQLKRYLPSTLWMWSYHESDKPAKLSGKIRAARSMPQFLRERMPVDIVESVRVQRVQDITEEEANREGVTRRKDGPDWEYEEGPNRWGWSPRRAFQFILHSTNTGSWERNDYVWVLEWRAKT